MQLREASCSKTSPSTEIEKCIAALSVCLCVFSSHSFWTSNYLDVPAGVTQEEGHTSINISNVTLLGPLFRRCKRLVLFTLLILVT